MRGEFDAVDLEGVEKVEVANNEFGLKYRMLRQDPKQKFLVFKDGPEPAMTALNSPSTLVRAVSR